MLDNIRIILVNPTHPGNVGAAARAMKNMGLNQLCLIEPRRYPSAEATARASGADDVLAAARVCQSLEQAVSGCRLVIGTSARLRTIAWPQLDPREGARMMLSQANEAPVALLFGREHSGLTNDELDRCHYLLHIPCNPAYPSINLAAAVQIVCYELMMSAHKLQAGSSTKMSTGIAAEDMERFYDHLQQALIEIDFLDPAHHTKLMRRLRRLFNRAQPDKQEINILRGILSAAQAARHRHSERSTEQE